jgi:hypothetical protein
MLGDIDFHILPIVLVGAYLFAVGTDGEQLFQR